MMSGTNTHSGGERESLSAFMDGELPENDADVILAACREHENLSADWSVYHCIGDVLRSSDMAGHSTRLGTAVGERLRDEPHFLTPVAPGGHSGHPLLRPLSAVAAMAAVAAVGIVAYPQVAGRGEVAVARAPVAAPAAVVVVANPAPVPARPLVAPAVSIEYVAAHRQYSGGPGLRGSLAAQAQTIAFESGR